MENVSVISLIISIVSIGAAIYAVCLSRKTYWLQSARPHSEKLLTQEILPWRENSFRFILQPASLPDLEANFKLVKIEIPDSFSQHLQTGYKEIFQKYTKWKGETKEHNEQLKELNREVYEKAKKETGLPSCSPRYKPPCVYYQRVVSYTLSKILKGWPEVELAIIPKNVSVPPKELGGLGKKEFFELSWGGGLVIESDWKSCYKTKEFIQRLQNSSELVEKIKKFQKNTEGLTAQCNELLEKINTQIIDKLKVGGIIKGKCDACC